MYCPECGQLLEENQKFCSECGTKIPYASTNPTAQQSFHNPTETSVPNDIVQGLPDFSAYVDRYVSEVSTFTSATSLIQGAKPLRIKWLAFIALTILGFFVSGPYSFILAFLVTIIAFRIIWPIVLIKRGSKKYDVQGHTVDLDDLARFLEKNLDANYFTAWERGTPSFLGMKKSGLLLVRCLFNKKTYHRVLFDQDDMSYYKIEVCGVSNKELFKDGGDRNPNLMYKSDYVVRPILEAAMKYYFTYVAK